MDVMPHAMRSVQVWAGACLAGTLCMVLLGGATRLTESGLSIVEWQLFKGIIPPWNAQAWDHLFALYRRTPEFIQKNAGMDIEGFKVIFWLEYMHRLLGRMLGLGVLMPGLIFWCRHPVLRQRISVMVVLMCSQGVMGWLMVQSGLIHTPWVSPYRLCIHLVLALLLFLAFLDLWLQGTRKKPLRIWLKRVWPVTGLLGLCCLTLCFGAFVAGLDAGLVYNTFPMMNGHWLPDRMWALTPLWCNIFENPGTVQWIHRVLGIVSLSYLACVGYYELRRQNHASMRILIYRTWILGGIQALLGISTLVYQVPLVLALMHQCTAFLLIGHIWVWITQTQN